MTIDITQLTGDEIQHELLSRSIRRTVEAIDRAQATLDALMAKHYRRQQEARRLAKRIAEAKKS